MMDRQLLLLGLLRQGEMHGYALSEMIDRFLQVCTDLKRPTAYFLLDRMARSGLVVESTSREGNYPERKVYSITPAGEARFFELLRENLAGFERTRYAGDIGLAFLHELPAEERTALLEERLARAEEAMSELAQVPVHGGSLDLIIDRNRRLLEAELEWLRSAIPRAEGVTGMHGFDRLATQRRKKHGADIG